MILLFAQHKPALFNLGCKFEHGLLCIALINSDKYL